MVNKWLTAGRAGFLISAVAFETLSRTDFESMTMDYTTLGKTGLRVSVAGLGTGGFSRMGLKSGLNEDQSARLVRDAIDLGVNFIDTAPPYGTEGVVGKALKHVARDQVVVATKAFIHRNNEW